MNVHMAAQKHAIDQDHSVLHMAVMGHVGIGHEHVLMADSRGVVLFFRAATDGDTFAKDIFVADLHPGWGSVVT